jgi:uncharacterized protein affecting Mg2+/Co2+ transport
MNRIGAPLANQLPLHGIIIVLFVSLMLLPLVSGMWSEQLAIGGTIKTGNWITPSPTATRTFTPTPTGQSGTTLEASKTASAVWENGKLVVSGIITVKNMGEVATRDLKIVDVVQIKTGNKYIDVVTTDIDVSAKPILNPGASFAYPYKIVLTPIAGAQYRNVAQVTITNHSGWLPGGNHCPGTQLCPFGPDVKVDFDVPPAPRTPTQTPTVRKSNEQGKQDTELPSPLPLTATIPATPILPTATVRLTPGANIVTATVAINGTTVTPTRAATAPPSPTLTPTLIIVRTPTPMFTPTLIIVRTPTPTFVATPTLTPVATATPTRKTTTGLGFESSKDTPIPTVTLTPTASPAPTWTRTPQPSLTALPLPTATAVWTATPAPTATATPNSK